MEYDRWWGEWRDRHRWGTGFGNSGCGGCAVVDGWEKRLSKTHSDAFFVGSVVALEQTGRALNCDATDASATHPRTAVLELRSDAKLTSGWAARIVYKGKNRMTISEIVQRSDTTPGRIFDSIVIVLILVSVIAVSIDTLPNLSPRLRAILSWSEVVIVGLFTIE